MAGRPEVSSVPESAPGRLADNGIAAYPTRSPHTPNEDGQIEELVLDDPEQTRLPVEMVFAYAGPRRGTKSPGSSAWS